MSLPLENAPNFDRSEERQAGLEIYAYLRKLILDGMVAPNTVLSQVELAKTLGVSRTPVREAIRRLHEAGLVTAEPNQRPRVRGFDPNELDALYAGRIMLEALAIYVSVGRMTDADIASLKSTIDRLSEEAFRDDFDGWLRDHRDFHLGLYRYAGKEFLKTLEDVNARSERYQRSYYARNQPNWGHRGDIEHKAIFEACRRGDARDAASRLAKHLARTALELLSDLAPEYEPAGVRSALKFITNGSDGA